jgi:hypothetical protein
MDSRPKQCCVKNFRADFGHPLNEAEERRKAKKYKKKKKVTGQRISQSEDQAVDTESDDEEEEEQVMIDWAFESWRKPGLRLLRRVYSQFKYSGFFR